MKAGLLDMAKLLIDMGASLYTECGNPENGATPLMLAARQDDVEAVKFLVSMGADVDHQTANGTTALMYAARFLKINAVKALLVAGVRLELKDSQGRNAAWWALDAGNVPLSKLLQPRLPNAPALIAMQPQGSPVQATRALAVVDDMVGDAIRPPTQDDGRPDTAATSVSVASAFSLRSSGKHDPSAKGKKKRKKKKKRRAGDDEFEVELYPDSAARFTFGLVMPGVNKTTHDAPEKAGPTLGRRWSDVQRHEANMRRLLELSEVEAHVATTVRSVTFRGVAVCGAHMLTLLCLQTSERLSHSRPPSPLQLRSRRPSTADDSTRKDLLLIDRQRRRSSVGRVRRGSAVSLEEELEEAMAMRRMILKHVPPTAVPSERRWSTDMLAEMPALVSGSQSPCFPRLVCVCGCVWLWLWLWLWLCDWGCATVAVCVCVWLLCAHTHRPSWLCVTDRRRPNGCGGSRSTAARHPTCGMGYGAAAGCGCGYVG